MRSCGGRPPRPRLLGSFPSLRVFLLVGQTIPWRDPPAGTGAPPPCPVTIQRRGTGGAPDSKVRLFCTQTLVALTGGGGCEGGEPRLTRDSQASRRHDPASSARRMWKGKGGGEGGGGGPREGLPRALAHPRWGRRGVPAVRRSAANGAGLPGGDSADLLAAVVKSDTGSRRYCGGRPASGCMDYGDGRWGGVAVAAAAAAAAGMPRVCRPRAVAVRAM